MRGSGNAGLLQQIGGRSRPDRPFKLTVIDEYGLPPVRSGADRGGDG